MRETHIGPCNFSFVEMQRRELSKSIVVETRLYLESIATICQAEQHFILSQRGNALQNESAQSRQLRCDLGNVLKNVDQSRREIECLNIC